MKNYKLNFTGRQVGAIGITYPIQHTYKANSLGEALFMLYTHYEHIQCLRSNGEVVRDTELIPCKVELLKTHPTTGAYIKTRSDNELN